MMLLIDAGNARLKWALGSDGALAAHGSASLADPAGAVEMLRQRVGAPRRVLVANVAGAQVAALLRAAFGPDVEFVQTQAQFAGLRCGYRDAARLGVDRWLAVLAAFQRVRNTLCVVDAGTALTVDAVAASGQHLGGLIVPGQRLMADALLNRTSDVGPTGPGELPPQGTGLFGRSTEEAVSRGALLAAAALVDRCAAQLKQATGEQPRLLVTGGDGEALLPWLESPCEFAPHLVLEGLACWASSRDTADA